jgi:uncharacterized RDD family membrane protein YckC
LSGSPERLRESTERARESPDYAGFGVRFAAAAIDGLLLFVISVPLVFAIYGRDYAVRSAGGFAGFWDFIIQIVAPALAVILFWRTCGATPGKIAFSARIVDAQSGRPASTGRLVARYFAYIVSSLPLFLGFAWIAIDRRKQGWHDKIAGTVVIYEE